MRAVLKNMLKALTCFWEFVKVIFGPCLLGTVIVVSLTSLLWFVEQGHDMLLTLGSSRFTLASLLTMLFALALFVWYTPRFLFEDNHKAYRQTGWQSLFINSWNNHHYSHSHAEREAENLNKKYSKLAQSIVPRMLGNAVFIFPSLGLINVMSLYEIPFQIPLTPLSVDITWSSPVLLLLGVSTSIFLAISDVLFSRYRKAKPSLRPLLITIGAIGLLFYYHQAIEELLHSLSALGALSLIILLHGVAFHLMVSTRKGLAEVLIEKGLFGKKLYPLLFRYSGFVSRLLILAFSGAFIMLLATNYNPENIPWANTIVVVCSALLLYTAVLFVFSFYQRLHQTSYVLIVFIALIGIAIFYKKGPHYEVKGSTTASPITATQRADLATFYHQWIDDRIDSIKAYKDRDFPLVIFNHEGGGSRAGYWSYIVMAKLDSIDGLYATHTFAVTGASGGMNGAALFHQTSKTPSQQAAARFYTTDFITPSIALLLGRDFWQAQFGYSKTMDRGTVQERMWESRANELWKSDLLTADLKSLYYKKGKHSDALKSDLRPLLLFNTTGTESGKRYTNWPIKPFDAMRWTGDFQLSWDKTHLDKGLKISNCMLLNSRFPYISPVGKLGERGTFADAGAYNNYSSLTTVELIKELRDLIANDTQLPDGTSIKIVNILVTNDPKDREEWQVKWNGHDSNAEKKVAQQITAPLTYIFQHRSAYHVHGLADLSTAADCFYHIALEKTKILEGTDSITPPLPLARSLSDYSIKAMDQCLRDDHAQGVIDDIWCNFK